MCQLYSSYSQVNVDGFHNIIELCREHKLRLFSPSTIGAFGPESPKHMCPDLTIMRPKTVYGVSKVYMELLGEVNNIMFCIINVVYKKLFCQQDSLDRVEM